ncbi:sodium/glutamate symporter [Pelagibius litoralis]|uniref:Sodium/glutamate symporter n=1 Tax=Pelagibius litoralis TaxID=374515 RepID=A0A967EWZ9_9PROT|nr:sodium/glutamate symporter [Pelagibius litoralis]NIA69138.1 sodium/glutamate symporter [Pelagibius litoralis]
MADNTLFVDDFLAYTIGIVVYFLGMRLNGRIAFLRSYNIPEPVTGGILAALVLLAIFLATGKEVVYDLETRDTLLVYFFTTIGLNARLSDLLSGGRPLVILLALTLTYIVFQNVVGVVAAQAMGQPNAIGVLVGSASLIGGHGTTIAWAPEIAASYGVPNALEIGVAAATLGLVLASLLGGPIAKYLMARHKIADAETDGLLVGIAHEREDTEQINHVSIMGVILVMHVAIIIGYFLNEALAEAGLKLPLFVSCLLVAILLSNTVPRLLPRMHWPARTRALAVVSDFSLGLFIAMSLMSMQLWSIADLAGPLLVLLALQALAAVAFILLVLFPLMGRDYLATVLSAGFAGFCLGATPTAIANMTAVTKTHGPAPTAFIILPLVGAFFVDITNAFVIRFFLGL